MVKTPCSQSKGPEFYPWPGNQISHASTKRSCIPQLRPSTTKYRYIYIVKINGISFLVILLLISAGFIDMPAFWAALEEPGGPHSHTWFFGAGCGMELLGSPVLGFCGRQNNGPQKTSKF